MVSVSPSSCVFSVRRCEPELVVPAKPTPRELKKLSDIDDQEGLRFQVPIIVFYKNNPLMKGQDPVRVIREALAKALVFYYPFAGRLIEGPNRKLIVDCTSEGVLFIEADANVTLEQLGDTIQPPCPYLEKLLYDVPGSGGIIGCPLLLIQVTRLICGGFIFALRMNHTMCDGFGLVQFLNTICEMSGGEHEPSQPPVWQRELFSARDPPRITCIHHEYDVVDAKGTPAMDQNNQLVHQSFFFGPKEIRAIRNRLPPHLRTSSTFEVLTACLWKCRTTALELGPDEVVSVTSIVNARGNMHSLHVLSGYYGNAVAFVGALSKAKMLSENPLGYAVELVKKAKARMSEEHIRSVADFMVIKGRPKYTTTGWNYNIVCDTTRIGYREVDFGWGKPVYGGPAGSTPLMFSLCIRFKNKVEDGIVVPICLPSSVMPRFQQELKKMTSELVEDSYSNVKPTRITSLL